MSLAGAITRLMTHAQSSGAKFAPDNPPESLSMFPFALAYLATGEHGVDDYNRARDLVTLNVDIFLSRALLASATAAATTWAIDYPHRLALDLTLNSNVDTVIFPVRSQFGQLSYNDETYYGIRFVVTVKILGTAST